MKIAKVVVIALTTIAANTVASSCNKAPKSVPVIKKAYDEIRAASKSDAIQYLKWQHRLEQAERVYNNLTVNPCVYCNGYGVVYQVDQYGNALIDYNGNYQIVFCPACGGTGEK